ncbi:unknown [Bacteroides sp. CAG:702]|nr:unknown [Bacteroides sp. CAG:702]
MCPFSCVLWAIFLVLSPLFFGQIARYLPITEAKNASKTHPKSSHDKFKTASNVNKRNFRLSHIL